MDGELVVIDADCDATRVDGAEPLVDVCDIGFIGGGGDYAEEVVFLLFGDAVGNDVGANGHEGGVAAF